MRFEISDFRSRARRAGFTLVELVASMVVLSIIASVASVMLFNATDGYVDASAAAQLHAEASIGMDRMVRELRRIPPDTSAPAGSPDIDSMSAKAITWNDDWTLSHAGTTLSLTEDGGAAAALLTDVRDFDFAAYDESNSAIALPVSGAGCDVIRRISITMTLDRHGVTETLRARVFLRGTITP